MTGIMDLARDAIAKLNGDPTSSERAAQENLDKYLEKKQSYREFQHENLPLQLSQFDPYTLPENFRLDPDVGPTSPYEYNTLRDRIYKHATNPKNATPSGLETLPAKDYNYFMNQPTQAQMEYYEKHPPLMDLTGAYALPRAMASAKNLGVPQLPPEMLAGLYLQEGRTDMGSNTHDVKNPVSNALVDTLTDKYGMHYGTASFLANLKEKQDLADKLGITFAEAWNGTGKVAGTKRTGKTYAKEFANQVKAAQMPENQKLMDMINLGIQHGAQYPLMDPRNVPASMRDNAGIESLLNTK